MAENSVQGVLQRAKTALKDYGCLTHFQRTGVVPQDSLMKEAMLNGEGVVRDIDAALHADADAAIPKPRG